jgi:hypothetical protein
MGTLMPTIGSPVPAPAVLAVVHCPLQLQVQTSSNSDQSRSLQVNSASESIPVPSALSQNDQHTETKASSPLEATLLSVTDDGRLWRWVINEDDTESESASSNGVKLTPGNSRESNTSGELVHASSNGFSSELLFKVCSTPAKFRRIHIFILIYVGLVEGLECISVYFYFLFTVSISFYILKSIWCLFGQQLDLTGQLQLLSSSVTTLAVPMPSILAMGTGKRQLKCIETFCAVTQNSRARLRQS